MAQRHSLKCGPVVAGWMVDKIRGPVWWARGRACLYVWLTAGPVHLVLSTLPVWGWHFAARRISLPDRVPSVAFAGRFFDLSVKGGN